MPRRKSNPSIPDLEQQLQSAQAELKKIESELAQAKQARREAHIRRLGELAINHGPDEADSTFLSARFGEIFSQWRMAQQPRSAPQSAPSPSLVDATNKAVHAAIDVSSSTTNSPVGNA